MIQIAQPIQVFDNRMLNPDEYCGQMGIVVLSTDEWIKMQEKAVELLNSKSLFGIIPNQVIRFWLQIVNGQVPENIRITKPDPTTNMR